MKLLLILPILTHGHHRHHHHPCVTHPKVVINDDPSLTEKEIPHDYHPLRTDEIPEAFDWRNVNGVNYVTRTLNQHIPKYCGSCWAHAATSCYSDRLKILRNATWPETQMSVQYALNCLTKAGTCNGGSDLVLYKQFATHGGPDDTCESYIAEDEKCTKANRCRNCFGPPGQSTCFPQRRYSLYKAKDYGYIRNINIPDTDPGKVKHAKEFNTKSSQTMIDAMKKEIYLRGPISCVVDAEPMFNYTGGIFRSPGTDINHVVSVTGWGVENDTEYWVVRNSWGTYWGEHGWMRLKTGENNVFLESFCSWVVPDWPPVEVTDEEEDLCESLCNGDEACLYSCTPPTRVIE